MGEVYKARDTKLKRDVAMGFCRNPSHVMRIGWPVFVGKHNCSHR